MNKESELDDDILDYDGDDITEYDEKSIQIAERLAECTTSEISLFVLAILEKRATVIEYHAVESALWNLERRNAKSDAKIFSTRENYTPVMTNPMNQIGADLLSHIAEKYPGKEGNLKMATWIKNLDNG